MPIQTIIKNRRKELGFTQEEVANYLGISTPAVNKWESGATYPDILLLSPLARLLKVDLNTLLCFQEELTEQEIHQFCEEVRNIIMESGMDKGFEMVNQKIEEYPNSAKLIHNLVLLLDGAMLLTGISSEERKKFEAPMNALYERAALSDDEDIRNGARFMLASKYIHQDNFSKAQEMLDLLPERRALDKRLLKAQLLCKEGKTAEAEEIYERRLLTEITESWNNLLCLIELELKEENLENASQLAAICSQSAELFQLSNYYKEIPLMMISLAQKKEEESIARIENMLSSSQTIGDFQGSVLFRHLPFYKNTAEHTIQILPGLLQEIESSEKFDFLRNNSKFQQLIERYQKKLSQESIIRT